MKYLLNAFSLTLVDCANGGQVTFWKSLPPSKQEIGEAKNCLNPRHPSTCAVAEAMGASPAPEVAPVIVMSLGDEFILMSPKNSDRTGIERELTAKDFVWYMGRISVCM